MLGAAPILITGAGGQVGSELRRALLAHGCDPVRVVAAERSRLDVTDTRAVGRAVRGLSPAVVLNAAAYTDVDRAEREPDRAAAVYAAAPAALAAAATRAGAVLVHFSTDYVFDGRAGAPYTPTDAPLPLGVYGRTKLDGERSIAASGARALILRTSWVYAARGRGFLAKILRAAAAGGELRVVSDQHGSPTWSRALAEATVRLLAAALQPAADGWSLGGREGLYHLAGRGAASRVEFARRILAAAGHDAARVRPVPSTSWPAPARRPPYAALDSSLARTVFGADLGPWPAGVDEAVRLGWPGGWRAGVAESAAPRS